MAKGHSKQNKKGINTTPFYVVLVALFVLFIYYQGNSPISIIIGIALFLLLIVLIIIEVTNGIKEEGIARNLLEMGIAVVVVLLFWFGLKFLLHTNYPIDIVPSCSMLPQLKRGDLLLLNGITSLNQLKAPVINISQSAFNNMQSNMHGEFLSCVAYSQNKNNIAISQTIKSGYSIGLYTTTSTGPEIVPSSYQSNNLITFDCGAQSIKYDNGTVLQEAYTKSIAINGTVISGDANNTIIVYATTPQDYFYQLGDSYIVHRVYAVLNVSGEYYVLTKGDNNPGLDLQYGNYPINMSHIEGKEIASVPYLGYLKLVLSNSFSEPAGCNSTVLSSQ